MVGPADLRLTLVLSPTQFAGGREADVVKSWGIVDRILTPGQGMRLAMSMRGLEVGPQTSLVHLGGDLYFSVRVARRLRAPAGAFAETSFIVRRHQAFARIFAASETLAQELRARGVPKERIVVTGDPRVDAVLDGAHLPFPTRGANGTIDSARPTAEGTDAVVSIFAGSRDRYFRTLLPYFMATADEVAAKRPGVTFQVIAAEFLTPNVLSAMQEETRRRWPALQVMWVTCDPWDAVARGGLTLTIPGTNTAELAILGVPFAVVVPLQFLDTVPTEGLLEYVGRIPGVGRFIKREAVRRYFAQPRLVALPNLRAGRAVVPEWIGRWTPAELANRVLELLSDAPRRSSMQTALRQVYPASGGAADAIARQALALATGRKAEDP
jgi:lipid-A-disaccharide synthase